MQERRKEYDLLIVGAGLFGAVVAHEALQRDKRVLVVERRKHIGGNCYTENRSEINVHLYGAHIFRTSDRSIWEYMEQFCEFNNFINSPIANYKGKLLNMPFNMNTFYALWGVTTPDEAKRKIQETRIKSDKPKNLKEHVLNLVGSEIYELLIKGYTEKQWGKSCRDLPPSIMRRIPLRFTFDNNYFRDRFQGIPIGGYTAAIEKMLAGSKVILGVDFLKNRGEFESLAEEVVYTGPIDEYFDYRFGPLEYRSLKFEHEELDVENYQGVAVMNFTDRETPYTRIIEHKHFEFGMQPSTIISREYPITWRPGMEPYYPLEDQNNASKYAKYSELATKNRRIHFGGRLGEYKYYDMQDTIKSALKLATSLFCDEVRWD